MGHRIMWHQQIFPRLAALCLRIIAGFLAPCCLRLGLHVACFHVLGRFALDNQVVVGSCGNEVRHVLGLVGAEPVGNVELPGHRLEPAQRVALRHIGENTLGV